MSIFTCAYQFPPGRSDARERLKRLLSMATIEPRLIHLLNESTSSPRPRNAELPPIKALSYPRHPSNRPPPIEPEPGQRPDVLDAGAGPPASQYPLLYNSMPDEGTITLSARKAASSYTPTDRSLPTLVSSQDLRMILDGTPADNIEDVSTKKRPVKEDFPQLPHPPKKQKSTSHMFPPIIVGLLEPPSDAALFPRISSGSFESPLPSETPQSHNLTKSLESQGVSEDGVLPSPPPDPERTPTGKIKRRAAKPRRKWSDEETNNLLFGVSKHGVGRWTDILEDRDYHFNERTAGDLKDRFRTCCPEELRGKAGDKIDRSEPSAVPRNEKKPRKGLMSENILNDTVENIEVEKNWPGYNDSESAPKQRKSRAHRKKMEDLAELGIKGPFKKSQRRERRPFSEQDDQEILEGFQAYGPHWTKIQRDPKFHLTNRQPTDLRDRLRNKYPEKFVSTEKTTMQVRNNLLEPSVHMSIESSFHLAKTSRLEPQLNRTGSREDIPKWPPLAGVPDTGEQAQAHISLSWISNSENTNSNVVTSEMDISRLLLDDNRITGEPFSHERRGF
ncbi:hypothetical protein F4802DRAFT_579588 [Xylaria palmicola]|nr:hypothetical protein F4802DRAFT_579588 [Xylaria palmicola]